MTQKEIWQEVVDHLGIVVPDIWIDELMKRWKVEIIKQDAPTGNDGGE